MPGINAQGASRAHLRRDSHAGTSEVGRASPAVARTLEARAGGGSWRICRNRDVPARNLRYARLPKLAHRALCAEPGQGSDLLPQGLRPLGGQSTLRVAGLAQVEIPSGSVPTVDTWRLRGTGGTGSHLT
jgi:hypothetical protein